MKEQHNYYVRKGKEEFVFVYSSGSEHEVMSAVLDMIFDESIDFDWAEATFVAIEIIDKLVNERAVGGFYPNSFSPPPPP